MKSCDICGRARRALRFCQWCSLWVCAGCQDHQAGVGHEQAEHKHEIERSERRNAEVDDVE